MWYTGTFRATCIYIYSIQWWNNSMLVSLHPWLYTYASVMLSVWFRYKWKLIQYSALLWRMPSFGFKYLYIANTRMTRSCVSDIASCIYVHNLAHHNFQYQSPSSTPSSFARYIWWGSHFIYFKEIMWMHRAFVNHQIHAIRFVNITL